MPKGIDPGWDIQGWKNGVYCGIGGEREYSGGRGVRRQDLKAAAITHMRKTKNRRMAPEKPTEGRWISRKCVPEDSSIIWLAFSAVSGALLEDPPMMY